MKKVVVSPERPKSMRYYIKKSEWRTGLTEAEEKGSTILAAGRRTTCRGSQARAGKRERPLAEGTRLTQFEVDCHRERTIFIPSLGLWQDTKGMR